MDKKSIPDELDVFISLLGEIDMIKNQITMFDKNNYKQILDYMVLTCAEALHISAKYNHKTVFVHIYLNGYSTDNFSLTLAKKMSNRLYSVFADTLEKGYIYSKSRLFGIIMKLLGNILAPETAVKFRHIRS